MDLFVHFSVSLFAHIDADSFFASVLVRKHPHLRGKPVLALGMGGSAVIAASYEAKKFGVKTGMRLTEARALVPGAIEMPTDFRETGLASEQIELILQGLCPAIEQMSIDEWFLDLSTMVGGRPNDCTAWAEETRARVFKHTAISTSVGIGPTKTLAKMASEYRKPGGVTVLGKEAWVGTKGISVESFLRDRPAAAIPGIGRKRTVHTDSHGWRTAWDFTNAPIERIKVLFGKSGLELQQELQGKSVYPVATEKEQPKSISRARSFRPERKQEVLWAHTLRHLEYTILKMRRKGLCCLGVSLWLRDDSYQSGDSANRSLSRPLSTEQDLQPIVRSLFNEAYSPRKRYTQVGLALWHLVPALSDQPSLFEDLARRTHDDSLQQSLDALHQRFGRSSITRGSALCVKTGTVMDMGWSIVDAE